MSKEPVICHRIRRKSRKKMKNGPSVNKYAHLVHKHPITYKMFDKTFRDLPIPGKPGEVINSGLRQIFHGRLYELTENVIIPEISAIPGIHVGMGKFKMVMEIKP